MKKIFAVASAALLVAAMLVGCSSKCDSCGKEGPTKKVTFAGESANLCSDCETLFNIGLDYLGM